MKIKRFEQLNEGDNFIEYTTEDTIKLLSNIVNEWETKKPSRLDQFLRGRILGAIESVLTLNGKLQGGKSYDYNDQSENFETMMIRMANEFINN